MDIARYFPVSPAPLRMQAGLHRFGTDFGNGEAESRLFQIDALHEETLRLKQANPARCHVRLESQADHRAATRAHAWMRAALTEHGLDGSDAPWLELVDRVQEDVVVLHRGESGLGRAVVVHVSFPSGWRPEHVVGASFGAIHGPVPDFAKLEAQSRSMVSAMVERGPYVRFVWTVSADGHLDHHPDTGARAPWTSDSRGWLRVERQMTVPLPEADASVFVIRVFAYPFESLSAEQRDTLAAALRAMPEDIRLYKGLPDPAVSCAALERAAV